MQQTNRKNTMVTCYNRMRGIFYVERIDELYRIASCMITKPGGITLTEATALGVPVILYKPVPGQEKENALYFEEKKAAIIVNQIEDIFDEVNNLLGDEKRLKQMKENIKKIHIPHSADLILEDMLKEASYIRDKKLMIGSVNY